jgi:hypothetical protein
LFCPDPSYSQLNQGVQEDCNYPDAPARDFLAKVASGDEPPVVLQPLEESAAESSTA